MLSFDLTFPSEAARMPFDRLASILKVHKKFTWTQKNANKIEKCLEKYYLYVHVICIQEKSIA